MRAPVAICEIQEKWTVQVGAELMFVSPFLCLTVGGG